MTHLESVEFGALTPRAFDRAAIPVIVLNLPRDTERLAWMDAQLRRLAVPFTVAPGIDGKAIPEDEAAPDMTRFRRFFGREMTRGELGCALAHLRVLRSIADGPAPLVCVMEDDIEITAPIISFLDEATLRLLPSFDVLRLFSNQHRQNKLAWQIGMIHGRGIVAPLRTGWGSLAQIYTREAARTLAKLPIRAPIDGMIYYDCPPTGLRILEVRPSLVRVRDDMGSNTSGWQNRKRSLVYFFKSKVTRPLGTWLHFAMTWRTRGIIGLTTSRYRPKIGACSVDRTATQEIACDG